MTNSESVNTRERILGAAVDLFSRVGYNGASTRTIARLAEVNEVTIYRYFPRKRDLFLAALESELSRINAQTDLPAQLANAPSARAALNTILLAINDTARRQPAVLRLVQFGALELGENLGPIYRKHLGELLDTSVLQLQRWVDLGHMRCRDPRMLIAALAATVVGFDTFFSVLWPKGYKSSVPEATLAYADIWDSAITASN